MLPIVDITSAGSNVECRKWSAGREVMCSLARTFENVPIVDITSHTPLSEFVGGGLEDF